MATLPPEVAAHIAFIKANARGINATPLPGTPEDLEHREFTAGLTTEEKYQYFAFYEDGYSKEGALERVRMVARKANMRLQVLDIGGSGVKSVALPGFNITIEPNMVTCYRTPDWDNFVPWLYKTGLLNADVIAISCAGFIDSEGVVGLFRVGNWVDKELVKEIMNYAPAAKIFLLNDAEAHLMAHADLYGNPQMSISIGTSLGFAMSDCSGIIVRPPDNINFDIGALAIPTRASQNKVWWALGSEGLAELQQSKGEEQGARQFGNRLGAFLAGISSVFRPATIVLSGGIIESWWEVMREPLIEDFAHAKPDWFPQPDIVKSPYGTEAALVGIAKYAIKKLSVE